MSFSSLHPGLQPAARWLYQEAARRGWNPIVTSTRRSRTQQARLYRAYLAGRSRLPANPPGQSLHEYGLAFDMVVSGGHQEDLGRIWRQLGGVWYAHDDVHFEVPR